VGKGRVGKAYGEEGEGRGKEGKEKGREGKGWEGEMGREYQTPGQKFSLRPCSISWDVISKYSK